MKKYFLLLLPFVFLLSCTHRQTIHPQYKSIVEAVYASGIILSEDEYKVFALSSGTITEKKVKDGDSVKAGQVLYIVSNKAASTQLQTAQSTYEQAQADLDENSSVINELKLAMDNAAEKFSNDSITFRRDSILFIGNGVGTQSKFDQAKTNYRISYNQKKAAEAKYYSTKNQLQLSASNAKSNLATAQETLGNFIIKSDSSGMVFQTFKEKGEAVHPGELVALLGHKSKRIIRLSVDQQDIEKVRIGQTILLKTDITGNNIYTAQVSRIFPVMNEADQTFRVDALLPDSVEMPFVHSSVEANIIIQKKPRALVIPRSALFADSTVITADKGETIFVATGIITMDDVEIISGIDDKKEIVIPETK